MAHLTICSELVVGAKSTSTPMLTSVMTSHIIGIMIGKPDILLPINYRQCRSSAPFLPSGIYSITGLSTYMAIVCMPIALHVLCVLTCVRRSAGIRRAVITMAVKSLIFYSSKLLIY